MPYDLVYNLPNKERNRLLFYKIVGLILLCLLLVATCSCAVMVRNYEGVSTVCIDRDLSDGDSCTQVEKPVSTNPEEGSLDGAHSSYPEESLYLQ